MEIKIQCDCGQRYKLDMEPANGLMPFTVNCPTCGADGTQKGNVLIQEALALSGAAPAAAQAPAGKLKLSLSQSHAPAPADMPAASAPPPISGGGMSAATARASEAATATRKPNFGLGLLGGLIGALAGAVLYFAIVKATGLRVGYFAIGVGGLAGWMAAWLGRGEGSKELAGITAVLAVACVIGAQYFVALNVRNMEKDAVMNTFKQFYDISVEEAKTAIKEIPTESDAEIRNYLAKPPADGDSKPDPSAVTADDIKRFREQTLPQYRDLAAGKVSREQFFAQLGSDPNQPGKKSEEPDVSVNTVFALFFFRVGNIFSLIATAGLAFRLSANA